jgi:hypothetical protein
MAAPSFGFDELDDLTLAEATPNRANHFSADRLGPLIELSILRTLGRAHLPSLADFSITQRLHALRSVDQGTFFRNEQATVQLTKIFWSKEEEPDRWSRFCRDMQGLAITSGFDKANSQGLVAALREFVDNIHDHSEAVATGLVGYAIRQRDLEFVVADSGIGILRSLRTSPEFHFLRGSGEALKIAIEDGKSRHGSLSGHGRGFRPLFQGLSNLASSLRIRSGDHALVVTGVSPTIATAEIQQKVHLPGVVISITCAP